MTASDPTASLRSRESATAAMLRSIDEKIARLTEARAERIAALQKIRSALVQPHHRVVPGASDHGRSN